MERDPPAGLVHDAGLLVLRALPDRLARMWLADWDGTLAVLRRLDPAPDWAAGGAWPPTPRGCTRS